MQLARSLPATWSLAPLYWTLTLVGAVYVALAISGVAGIGGCGGQIVACDAASYYYADGYNAVAITPQYGYSPAFTWAFAPFRLLTFDAFVWVWAALHVGALLWLRAGWFLAIPGVNEDVIRGNVTVFIAVAVVLAVASHRESSRQPDPRTRTGSPRPSHVGQGSWRAAAWAAVLLTKVLPGVGILWHLGRGDKRALAWASGATLLIVLIGAIIAPQVWIEWIELLSGRGTGTAGTLVPRLVLAVGIVAYAARTDRAWLVPVGSLMAWSYLWPPAFMVLAAIPKLARR